MAVAKEEVGYVIFRCVQKGRRHLQHFREIARREVVRLVHANLIAVDSGARDKRVNTGFDAKLLLGQIGRKASLL